MIADFDEIMEFARQRCLEAIENADNIRFGVPQETLQMSHNESSERHKYGRGSVQASSITDTTNFGPLEHTNGIAAWAIVLSVDMRRSSRLARDLGPKNMFIAMHTFMATLIRIAEISEGLVIGLRGDGLFAGFGVTETKTGRDVTSKAATAATGKAVNCGEAMVEAVCDIVNVVLRDNGINADIQIGVGVDVGDIVITRIGYKNANELTAYGPAVDNACKNLSEGQNKVRVSNDAWRMFPTGKDGRVKGRPVNGGIEVDYPDPMLGGARHTHRRGSRNVR